MGAGKSTALAAAREAGLETTEADELMERELGMSIVEFFEREGEEAFRAREAEVVGALLEQAEGGAIALGGGSVLSERVRTALERHQVVWLAVGPEEAWRRVGGADDRPLAQDQAAFAALLEERAPLYESLADAVLPAGKESLVPDAETLAALAAARALAELPRGTRMLSALVVSTVVIGLAIWQFETYAPLVTLLVPLVVSSLVLGPRQLPWFVVFVLLVLALTVPTQSPIRVRTALAVVIMFGLGFPATSSSSRGSATASRSRSSTCPARDRARAPGPSCSPAPSAAC